MSTDAGTTAVRHWPGRMAWTAAIALAVAGMAVTIWRPLAPSVPDAAGALASFDAEVEQAVRAYRVPRLAWATVLVLLDVAVPVALVGWGRSRRWLIGLAGPRAHAPGRGGLVAAAVVAVTTLATAPLLFWLSHVHRVEWGFRTASAMTWLRDLVLGLGLEVAVAAVAVATLLAVMRRGGRAWPAWATLVGTGLTALLVVVHPLVVEPLFLPTRPLDDPVVRDQVQAVLDRAGVQGDLLVGDASVRTTNVNAHVAGLGPTTRVVLYDTLLELPPDQVAAVVAHELAHREHDDIPRGVLLTAAGLLPGLVALGWLLRQRRVSDLVDARGPSDPRLVPVVVAAVAVATVVSLPVSNLVSRRAEAAADARALELTADPTPLVRTYRTFVVRDLAWIDPPVVHALLFGTHPPVVDRINAIVDQAVAAGLVVPDVEQLGAREVDDRHPRIGR